MDSLCELQSKYLLVQQLLLKVMFLTKKNKQTNKQKTMAYFSNTHPTGSGICHNTLPVTVCPTHRTLGFTNGTNVRQLLALPQHF
jgi:hypothetical protein